MQEIQASLADKTQYIIYYSSIILHEETHAFYVTSPGLSCDPLLYKAYHVTYTESQVGYSPWGFPLTQKPQALPTAHKN